MQLFHFVNMHPSLTLNKLIFPELIISAYSFEREPLGINGADSFYGLMLCMSSSQHCQTPALNGYLGF